MIRGGSTVNYVSLPPILQFHAYPILVKLSLDLGDFAKLAVGNRVSPIFTQQLMQLSVCLLLSLFKYLIITIIHCWYTKAHDLNT